MVENGVRRPEEIMIHLNIDKYKFEFHFLEHGTA